jgi:Zn-dependent protease
MKCRKCGQETFLPFQCPYCGDHFCTVHRLPENHNCPRMELARTQRQEDAVVFQEPSSYEYRVTYGAPRRATGRIYFSPKELKHFAVATLLVIGIGLSIGLFSDVFVRTGWLGMSFFAVILTASFLTHEIAHKVTAQKRGLWAEFRLTLWGAALTLISVISPLFKIIAPGAVMISGPARMDEIAKISIAGPIINIVFSSVLLGAAFVPNPYSELLLLLALWNGFIALFNLIPMGILDGYKIFSWDKTAWALAFVPSLVLTLISYVMVSPYM